MRLTAAADRERKQAATERLLDADVHLSSASGLCSQREREREVESSPRAAERETKAGGSSRGLTSTMLGKRIEGGGRWRRGRRGKQSEEFRERSRRTKKKTLSDGRKKKTDAAEEEKCRAPRGGGSEHRCPLSSQHLERRKLERCGSSVGAQVPSR